MNIDLEMTAAELGLPLPVGRGDELTVATLAHLERSGVIPRGAAAELDQLSRLDKTATPAGRVASILGRIAAEAHRYQRSDYKPASKSPLAATLALLPLAPGEAETLAESWDFESRGRSVESYVQAGMGKDTAKDHASYALAEWCVGRLETRDHSARWAPALRPAAPSWEVRVADTIRKFQSRGLISRSVDPARVASERDWLHLGHRPPHEVAQVLLDRLRSGHPAVPGGSTPASDVKWDDPLLRPAASLESIP